MKNRTALLSLSLVLAASTLAVAGSKADAPPAGPKLGDLVMDGHDAGHILYADRCSNGGNSDDAGRAKFIAAMRADKQSKLAKALAAAESRFVHDKQFYEIDLGDWFQTYHLRDGCANTSISYSAPIYLLSKMSNIHEVQTKYLVTIDDDVAADRRSFRLRSITPLALRDH